jgi:hypothetical protein
MSNNGALLGACLALPLVCQIGTAAAAQPEGRYVYVPPGATVVVLPAPDAPTMPSAFPVARIIAQQDGMIRRLMADMDAMMAMPFPDPQQMIRSVMAGMPQVAPGAGLIMTSVSSGNGSCSQTITYGPATNGAQPQVKVTQTGDACGAMTSSAPIDVTQTLPEPRPATPDPVAPRHGKIWTIGYPPHPVANATPPRS